MFPDSGKYIVNTGNPPLVTAAEPFNATGDSSDPATSAVPSPMVVTVCGVPKHVVSVNTSTSPTLSFTYSVPTESPSNDSVRAKSMPDPVIRSGNHTGVWFRLPPFSTNVREPSTTFCATDMLITPSYIGCVWLYAFVSSRLTFRKMLPW